MKHQIKYGTEVIETCDTEAEAKARAMQIEETWLLAAKEKRLPNYYLYPLIIEKDEIQPHGI